MDIAYKTAYAAQERAAEERAYMQKLARDEAIELAGPCWYAATSIKSDDNRTFAVRKVRTDPNRVIIVSSENSTYYTYVRTAEEAKKWLRLRKAQSGNYVKLLPTSARNLNRHIETLDEWI